MIVIDANLLIYAYDAKSPDHEAARTWLEAAFASGDLIGLPWQNIHAFLRILTHPAVYGGRYKPQLVLEMVDQWMALPQVRALSPGERHWSYLRQALENGDARGKLTSDAALAAITMEYGGVLHTTDRDFARFPGLRWVNPLAAS